jgi:methyl-accepting chemotaxis protein
MIRPLSLLLALACLVLPIAACGGGDDEPESTPEFDAAYAPVNEGLLELAAAAVDAVGQPGARVTEKSAAAANELAEQSADLAKETARLEPPEDLAEATGTVETSLEELSEGFEALAAAAEKGNQQAATAAIEKLGSTGQTLNGAQNFLAEATGVSTGDEG